MWENSQFLLFNSIVWAWASWQQKQVSKKTAFKVFSFGKLTCLLLELSRTTPQACKSPGSGRKQCSELGASEKQECKHFQGQPCSPPTFNFGAQQFTHGTLHPTCGCPTQMAKRDSENRDDSNPPEEILYLNTDWNCPKGKKTISRCCLQPGLFKLLYWQWKSRT